MVLFFIFLSSNLMPPVGGLFIAIFVGWVWGRKNCFFADIFATNPGNST